VYEEIRMLTKNEIKQDLFTIPSWFKMAHQNWENIILQKDFPCHFGTIAEKMGHLRYSYIENNDISGLPNTLREFLTLSRTFTHCRHALVVFFEPELQSKSFEYYQDFFWKIIQFLHEHDDKEWIEEDFPTNPDDPNWEFVFDGDPIFISANMPAYKQRITRNFGQCLILIFQPRRIFSDISHTSKQGKKAIHLIRSKVEAIEHLPIHPDLGGFGDPSKREWKQYVITDDYTSRDGQCPFHYTRRRK